jgi:hypothetical protein
MTRGLLRHPFLRRVPLLLLVLAGAFLWRSALFPQPRTLIWELPASVSVARAEIQLWKGPELVGRAEWPNAPSGTVLQKLELRRGAYRALTFLELTDGGTEHHAQTVDLEGEETVQLWFRPR